jgi:hypothetical protein
MNEYDVLGVASMVVFLFLWWRGDRKLRDDGVTTYRRVTAAIVLVSLIVFGLSFLLVLPFWVRLVPVLGVALVLFGWRSLYRAADWIDGFRPTPRDIWRP